MRLQHGVSQPMGGGRGTQRIHSEMSFKTNLVCFESRSDSFGILIHKHDLQMHRTSLQWSQRIDQLNLLFSLILAD